MLHTISFSLRIPTSDVTSTKHQQPNATKYIINTKIPVFRFRSFNCIALFVFCNPEMSKISIGAISLCCNIVTIYYVNNTTNIYQQLLKVKILATCFSYNEPSSDQKRKIVLVHSVIVHSMGSHIIHILYYFIIILYIFYIILLLY